MEETYEEVGDFIFSHFADTPPCGTHEDNQEKPNVSQRLNLPTISIPSFSGMYCEWLSFRDLFSSLVIENNSLLDAKRLYYLKASLKGEALLVAQNQPGTSDNFQIIWKNLKQIVDLPDITSDWLNNLKNMRNIIVTVTTALRNLKRPINEDKDLFFLLINKFDKTSRDQWELSRRVNTDHSSFNQLN